MPEKKRLPRIFNPARWFGGETEVAASPATETQTGAVTNTSERGYRPTPENRTERLYRMMWVDTNLRASVLDIRKMDRLDPRVKKIHSRTSRAATKGGLQLRSSPKDKHIQRLFEAYVRRLGLDRQEKLESDMRGLLMEGNLAMQWVIDRETRRVVSGVRMPAETILPNVDANGLFKSAHAAYLQHDIATGTLLATFPLWQMTLARLCPDNYDDHGAMGRPYLDAGRSIWKKLTMTEEDLVIRRRERAVLMLYHAIEGYGDEEMKEYQRRVEDEQKEVVKNFYFNRKGAVGAVGGDANMDQIKDISLLQDAFYSSAPGPKQLFGYIDGLNRDILEDLKKDWYDELDALQDTESDVYEQGFRLELLLNGINPDAYDFSIQFAERQTETPNQRADRALKFQAMGASQYTVWETGGLSPQRELALRQEQLDSDDPYPSLEEEAAGGAAQRVSITPGNRRKGESSTDITSRSSNS